MKAIKPHAHCLQYLRITINLMKIRSAPQLFCWCHRFTDSLIEPPSRLPRPWVICCWMVGTLYIQYCTVFKKCIYIYMGWNFHIYIYIHMYICINTYVITCVCILVHSNRKWTKKKHTWENIDPFGTLANQPNGSSWIQRWIRETLQQNPKKKCVKEIGRWDGG